MSTAHPRRARCALTTRADRADKVDLAAQQLPGALSRALAAEANPQTPEAVILALWADVEALGAIIHRQSRLLAGKSKGG